MRDRVTGQLGLIVTLVAFATSPALAQSTYVGAAFVGDVLRTTHTESPGGRDFSGGEAIGFALRVGTPLGSRWGVDLEFTRPGEIESEIAGPIPLASRASAIAWSSQLANSSPVPSVFPPLVPFGFATTERHTTLSTSAWVVQDLSERVSLVYLAGMGFYRTTYETESRFEVLPVEVARPIVLPSRTRTVTYGVRPLAGFEGRIGLTEHVDLTPGVRLHGIESGWLMRPAVGLAWKF